jgi:hypothetical protein
MSNEELNKQRIFMGNRLIYDDGKYTFKKWIEQHNPKLDWNWDNPTQLVEQFCNCIGETGDIDLKTLFILWETNFGFTGLEQEQVTKFSQEDY